MPAICPYLQCGCHKNTDHVHCESQAINVKHMSVRQHQSPMMCLMCPSLKCTAPLPIYFNFERHCLLQVCIQAPDRVVNPGAVHIGCTEATPVCLWEYPFPPTTRCVVRTLAVHSDSN